jgi:hypothetical protein
LRETCIRQRSGHETEASAPDDRTPRQPAIEIRHGVLPVSPKGFIP